MELNFFENLKNELEKNVLKRENKGEDIELELAEKLDAIQEFSVDRIEQNLVILENRKSGEMVNIEKDKIPFEIKEGDILKLVKEKYILDEKKTIDETERIRNKMDSLWD